MTEPTEAMKAMARRVCARVIEGDSDNPLRVMKANRFLAGDFDDEHHMAITLAAIIETQRADAELAEDRYLETDWQEPGQHIAQAIRTGNHYGKDESNGN